jgi:hypothetical protein
MLNTDINRNNITRRKFLQITAASMFLALLSRESVISAFMGLNDVSSSSGNVATAWTSWLWSQTNRSQMDAGLLSNVETATSPGNVKLAMLASDFYTSGTISSQIFDSEEIGTRWDALIWDEVLVPNTGITFQVRASDTPFAKDASSPSWSTAYGSSPVQSGMPSGRYMQWRATLTTSDVSSTPTINEVRVYYSGPITSGAIQVTDIGDTSGTAQVSQLLTAGALTPSGAAATANYQWQKSLNPDGPFNNIAGATSNTYSIIMADLNSYIRVMATGTGAYKGSVASAYIGSVDCLITAIGPITGTTEVAETLTAGELTPSTADVSYQWKRCATVDGTYENIEGATSGTYIIASGDYAYYIKVTATGIHPYTGEVTSTATEQIGKGQITGISPIIGTTASGQTLTAGTVSPSGATVSYQWQRSDGASFVDIDGATSNTYTLSGADVQKYIKIVVTGTGSYTGTASAVTTDPVQATYTPITAIDTIAGIPKVGNTLTPGALSPSGATATYQWQSCATPNGTYEDIDGAALNSYTLIGSDLNKYIKVVATGSGSYSGTVTSAYIGPVQQGEITAIAPISGSTVVGEILTAGALTPASATVTYQWQRLVGETYTDISGATSNTYLLVEDDYGKYIKVVATGSGNYTGTVSATTVSPVTTTQTPLTAIGTISGTAQVNSTLTAGALTPSGATANYQWKKCLTENGTYENIGTDSSTYTLQASDLNYYIKVTATGSGNYSGTQTSAARGPVAACPLVSMSAISGTTAPGYTLTAGTINPVSATVSYQWYRSDTEGTTYTVISGAVSSTYTVQGMDSYMYLKVIATGTGSYTGSVYAITSSRVSSSTTPITAIGDIIGTAQVGQTLTAGALTPSGATATYQWQKHDTASGEYENITGATANSYTLTGADYDYYIKVVATGSGAYSGAVTSNYVGKVTSRPVTAIGNISGTTTVGQTLTAGTLTPSTATVTYQWQKCSTYDGEYTDIYGAVSNSYTLMEGDYNYYFMVKATGNTGYTGTVYSNYVGPVASVSTPLESIGDISGTAQVEQTLTAGSLTPEGATATYQWKRCDTSDGNYETGVIPGATSNTYTLVAADNNKYIKVFATGSGEYSGTVESDYAGPVTPCPITAIGPVIGTTAPGYTLTAGALTPAAASVTYQWQYSDTGAGTTFTNIPGATNNTYYIQNSQYNYSYIRVVAEGSGAYSGSVNATTISRVASPPTTVTAIGYISGQTVVGQTVTAGALTPSGATVFYQWQKCATSGGTYTNISGATSSTYTLTSNEVGYYIKVVAQGYGSCTGTVTSAYEGPVQTSASPINISAIAGVTVPVKGATPDTTIDETTQYRGSTSWAGSMSAGKFKSGVIYTATITLTPRSAYTVTGVTANFFTVAGATSVTNPVDSGVVTAVFPQTA